MSSDFEKPTHDQPVQVGEVVDVVGLICNRNDVGGTTILENPGVECRVEKAFWDYETGWRFHGRVIDDKVVENFRKQAMTGYTPEHYKTQYPANVALYEDALKAQREFDPSYVYFSEHDLAPHHRFSSVVPGR